MARKKNKNPNPDTPPAGDAKETPPENPKTDDGGGGNGNANNNGGGGGGGKKEAAPATVVLKVDMHCQGCTKRIRDSVRGFPGVEAVATDVGGGRLTVVGKVDAAKLRERVASKTRKAVDIVTPAKTKDAAAAAPADKAAATAAAAAAQKDQPKPADDPKKPKLPAVATVVLKVRLHCPGCIQRIRRTILKIRGTEQVTFDPDKDQVTVKGSMDAKKLPELLTAKLKRPVEVVVVPPPKKDDKKEKNNDGGGGGDNKEKNNNKSGGGEGGGGGKKENAEEAKLAEANKMEYYGGYGYHVEMVHAPLLFSDENPNACSVM